MAAKFSSLVPLCKPLSEYQAEQTATYQDMLSGNRDKGSEVGSFTGTTSTSSKDGGVKDSYDVGLRYARYINIPYNFYSLV